MRQVDQSELEWLLMDGLRQVSPAKLALLADRRPEQQRLGRELIARHLAGRFARLEVLSAAPAPPHFRAAGEPGGAPPIAES